MAKFKIFNKTNKHEEIVYGDDREQLLNIYKQVGEDIEIIQELTDERPVDVPVKAVRMKLGFSKLVDNS